MHHRLETYLLGQRFAGVEAESSGDGVRFRVIIVKRQKGQLRIEQEFLRLHSLDELPAGAIKNIPVILTITGKGVIHRTVQSDRDTATDQLARKAIPDISLKEFAVQSIFNESAGHIVALARNSRVEEIGEQVTTHGTVIATYIGAVNVHCLRELLHQELIVCGNHELELNASGLKHIRYSETQRATSSVTIKDEPVNAGALIGFSGVVQFLLTQNQTPVFEEYLQEKLFRVTAKVALAGLLILLLCNYLAFSAYHSRASELQAQPEAGGQLVDKLNALRIKADERRTFLESTGLLEEAPFAWYADQLAHDLPEGIQLTQMNFSPRVKLAEEDSIGFTNGELLLSGSCSESIQLNKWVQQLKNREWVRAASILSYEQNRSQAKGVFHLKVNL